MNSLKSVKSMAHKGFTLIELVIVIIILSVLGIATSNYIVSGVDIYTDIAERDNSLNSVRFVMERLRREVSSALPNSALVTSGGQCLTFTPIAASSTYASDFPISPLSAGVATIAPMSINFSSASAAVYLLSQSELSSSKVRAVSSYTAGQSTLSFTEDVSFPLGSPAKRIYIIQNNISYYFTADGSLRRGSGCSDGVLMAENIKGSFTASGASLLRSSLVKVTFTLDFDGQEVPVEQTVHINNVP
ncbi:prepilin-type N-terminal cleavage/methylation domain-containing protein [Psychromonas aquimarina]|uniref:prepilin-type N-terminal cleavage/methylation domain-containing protein n=1 Tax=Psychromonas aquimarina TaxID=444919 RepID=UPI0003FB5EA0|nr:prepilin-type N-terminal cleavage/methylation domain-containing protein [Psychromonas aquimarina]